MRAERLRLSFKFRWVKLGFGFLLVVNLLAGCSRSSLEKAAFGSGVTGKYVSRKDPRKTRELRPDGSVYLWGEGPGGARKPDEGIFGRYEAEGDAVIFKVQGLGTSLLERSRVKENMLIDSDGEVWVKRGQTASVEGGDVSRNEASAVSSLRTINIACATYAGSYNIGYPKALKNLGPGSAVTQATAGLIDEALANGTKDGYTFTYRPGPPNSAGRIERYSVVARPLKYGTTGVASYSTDPTGVIRETREVREPTVNDPPVGG